MMHKINALHFYALLVAFASLSYASDLTEDEMVKLCQGHETNSKVAHPTDTFKYVACFTKPVEVQCKDGMTAGVPMCFNYEKQKCLDSQVCIPNNNENPTYVEYIKATCQTLQFGDTLPALECENFYQCLDANSNPTQVKQTCPKGEHFSKTANKCMAEYKAGCIKCSSENEGYKYAAANCYQYYVCKNNKPKLQTCQYGEYFDKDSKKCRTDKNHKCTANADRKPTCTPNNNGERFAHPECDKFYICMNEAVYEAQCAPGSYFESRKSTCVQGSC